MLLHRSRRSRENFNNSGSVFRRAFFASLFANTVAPPRVSGSVAAVNFAA